MRAFGLYASLLAAAQFVMVSTPAFASKSATSDATAASQSDPKPTKTPKRGKTPKPKADAKTDAATTPAPTTKKPRGKKPKKKPEPVVAADPTPPPAPEPPPPPPAPEPPPPPAPEPPKVAAEEEKPADPPAPVDDGTVEVHIDSTRSVSLEKRTTGSWEPVCAAPCDQKLAVTPEYRVVGDNVNPSEAFHLDGSKGSVTLKIDPGVQSSAAAGTWIALGSVAVLAGGVVVMAVGMNRHADSQGQLSQGNSNAMIVGSTMALAGVVGGITGAALYFNNRQTGIAGDVIRTTNEKGAPAADGKFNSASASRTPVWNTPKPDGMPAYVTVPVFAGTF